ncbi:Elongation factor Ts [Alphaproteobacteria bacterium SO-S41]|nr:Elongation factor Ts [Alphaproteobacteria bacterium SO-S41]
MTAITASMVKDLREKTGAGMMDCKTALTETNGDIEAAIDWLRKKGITKAAKKAGRTAAEGLVGVALAGTKGVVVEVNSETDFVARNTEFQEMVSAIAAIALDQGADVETVKAAAYPGGGTVADKIQATVAKIGEHMALRRAAMLSVEQGVVASYIHTQIAPGLGKIGVIVALESTGSAEALTAFGRQVAMHIAAATPLAVDASGIDPALIEREKAIIADKAAASGKPANIVEKIVESGIKTFLKEVCLLDQPFVHNGTQTVAQAAKEAAGKVGGEIKITGFHRIALGEGIEKEESDFAAEVMAAAKG